MIQIQSRITIGEDRQTHIDFDLLTREDTTDVERKIGELFEAGMKLLIKTIADGECEFKDIKKGWPTR